MVDTGVENVKATVYVVQGRNDHGFGSDSGHLVVAVASWEQVLTTFTLTFDWQTINTKLNGWPSSSSSSNVAVEQPAINLIQTSSSYSLGSSVPVQPRHGMLLIVSLKDTAK